MRIRILDQVHISSISSETLRAGQEVNVSDAFGGDLLARHPDKYEKVGDDQPGPMAAFAPIGVKEKSEPKPGNKSEPKPDNKSDRPDYGNKTVPELRTLASERKIDLGAATKKADIIAAIELADQASTAQVD